VREVNGERRAAEALVESGALQRDAVTAKYRDADFAGWQTGYAFDTFRGVPDASSDSVGQRKEFLRSTAAFRDDLARIRTHLLSPAERARVEARTFNPWQPAPSR
jgi:hypothetical protein